MNLISKTHHFYERREYVFNVLPEYLIITRRWVTIMKKCMNKGKLFSDYDKYVFTFLTLMMGPTIINETYYLCKRRERIYCIWEY